MSDKGSLGDSVDSINVVTDKHEDEASTVKKVDDTTRANSQVNPQNTNCQVNDQGCESLILMTRSHGDFTSVTSKGDSKAKADSEVRVTVSSMSSVFFLIPI